MLIVRNMVGADIALGLHLCRTAGWNQVAADWHRLLALEPDGCFLAEVDGHRAGTATAISYGQNCGWIGMVLVDPGYRRRGIGTALLERCIHFLQTRPVAAIRLDATPSGREVYLRLGFIDEYEVRRYAASPDQIRTPRRAPSVRALRETDWPQIARLDRAAFGADRMPLLRRLAFDDPERAVVAAAENRIVGFGLGYRGHDACHVGPITSSRDDAAADVLDALLGTTSSRRVHLDVLGPNPAAADLAQDRGFEIQRRLMRMVLGRNASPGTPGRIYAASGFETG